MKVIGIKNFGLAFELVGRGLARSKMEGTVSDPLRFSKLRLVLW
jgi:hypothetical protein